MRPRPLALLPAVALLLAAGHGRAFARKPVELRIATLLPQGSSWMKEFSRFARAVRRRTQHRVKIRFYPGAVMGDERDVIRKMRHDRLQGGLLTGVGIGQIYPRVRVLELPFLFAHASEFYAVRRELEPEFRRALRDRGFELLAWGDIGWIRFYSRRKLRTMADVRKARAWIWVDDPMAGTTLRKLGLRGLPLSVQDVLPSLQTGVIDTIYGPPYTTLALQWHTKVRYYSEMRLTYAAGGVLLTRKAVARLSSSDRRILLAEARELERKHLAISRRDNARALRALRKLGLTPVEQSPALRRRVRRLAREIWKSLTGKLYPKALLHRVLELRDRARREAAR